MPTQYRGGDNMASDCCATAPPVAEHRGGPVDEIGAASTADVWVLLSDAASQLRVRVEVGEDDRSLRASMPELAAEPGAGQRDVVDEHDRSVESPP